MKALTLKPDYAAYILHGLKQYETRPKSVGTKFRGDLVIHAGVSWTMAARFRCRRLMRTYPEVAAAFATTNQLYVEEPSKGVMLCIVTVVDIVPVTDVFDTLTPLEIAVGDYSYVPENPRYAWKLENVRPLPCPIPAKGKLGLWNWEAA